MDATLAAANPVGAVVALVGLAVVLSVTLGGFLWIFFNLHEWRP